LKANTENHFKNQNWEYSNTVAVLKRHRLQLNNSVSMFKWAIKQKQWSLINIAL